MAAVIRCSVSSKDDESRGESLDPRICDELEKLNKASENINRLELELEQGRLKFKKVLCESTQQLDSLAKKLGSCIDKSRPYYDARFKLKEAQLATQNAAMRFERACSQLVAAKEMVNLAEQGYFNNGTPFDPAWQEMLNHSTMKVNDSERERLESEIEHMKTAQQLNEAEQLVRKLQRDWKRNIAKSKPYFELKATVSQQMEDQKKKIGELEERVSKAKTLYSSTLRRLEEISDEIHAQRRRRRREKKRAKALAEAAAEAAASGKEPVIYHPLMDIAVSSSPEDESDAEVSSSGDEKPTPGTTTIPLNDGSVTTVTVRQAVSQKDVVAGRLASEPVKETPATSVKSTEAKPTSNGSAAEMRSAVRRTTSLAESSTTSLSPISPDSELMHANAAVMAAISRSKQQRVSSPFLRPNSSRDDVLSADGGSETESFSGSFVSGCGGGLDDEQIESLMLDMGEYRRIVAEMDANESDHFRQMELPARLRHLRDFVTFEPIFVDDEPGCCDRRFEHDDDSRDLDVASWDSPVAFGTAVDDSDKCSKSNDVFDGRRDEKSLQNDVIAAANVDGDEAGCQRLKKVNELAAPLQTDV